MFLKEQGYDVVDKDVYQDNMSAILLEENGRKSAGERTRALNVRYFVIMDHVNKGDVKIKHCPTDKMVADYYTKLLQGKKFEEFRRQIMGFV